MKTVKNAQVKLAKWQKFAQSGHTPQKSLKKLLRDKHSSLLSSCASDEEEIYRIDTEGTDYWSDEKWNSEKNNSHQFNIY